MVRRTLTRWVAVVAAGVLLACGAEPEDTSVLRATTEAEQETPPEGGEAPAPGDTGEERRTDETERDNPKGDGETPWHLLPKEDWPAPVEPHDCELASPTPVAC
jgi:hypothetical protein